MKKNPFKAPLQWQNNFLFKGSLKEAKNSCCSLEQGEVEDGDCCPQPEDGSACCQC